MKFTDDIPKVICIYKITNVKTNLIMIGSTINLYNRVNHYRNDINKDNPLKHYNREFLNDIINYGINSFIVDIIEEFDSITNIELKNKETNYIIKYNSNNPNIGYNIRLDINGKYICANSTKYLKSTQTKEQWVKGIRDSHSNTMKEYWKDNQERKDNQSNVMKKALTRFNYNVYNMKNEIIYSNIDYKQLNSLGYRYALQGFCKADKEKLKTNKSIIFIPVKRVTLKNVIVERINIFKMKI